MHPDEHSKIAEILRHISSTLIQIETTVERGPLGSGPRLVNIEDLKQTEIRIMSAITDWASKEQADLDSISGTLDGIVAGITALDALITSLQNSPGTISAADQAALDAIQAASKALVTKSGAIVVTPPAS